ncbi:glycoside hydrolase family 3 protein [Mycena floridula]|nr:glycoside hydrolase family 3 protein [Mycena floridula]
MTFDVEDVLGKLAMADKIKLLTGLGWWNTQYVPVNITLITRSPGPNGVRGTRFFNGVPSSCFPSSTGLDSSFDVELATQVGEALGDEARAKGCHILLAPTVNTQRSPLGGRVFESFSEDPHLNGTMAAACINGLQSKGVGATIKHFVANDQEFQKFSISSEVSERALREIYLKPFQIAIKKSNPWALMSSHNRVNGVHASENPRLLDDILRKEWGYQGMIMSDWTGTYSTAESIKAGLDLEMPGPSVMRGKAIERYLTAEKLFPSDIDDRLRKILELVAKAHKSGIPFNGPEGYIDTPEQRAILRKASANSVKSISKIAVIGPNAKEAMTSGGGSARLLSTYTVSPLAGIKAAAQEIGSDISYTVGSMTSKYLPLLDSYIKRTGQEPEALLEFWNEEPWEGFLDLQPDFGKSKANVWSTPTARTECFFVDGIISQYSTKFVPDESGDWEFQLTVTNRGNLFLNNALVIDLSTNPESDPNAFFGLGTKPVTGVFKGLVGGKEYNMELRLSNIGFNAKGATFECWGGFRLGGRRIVDPDIEIREAVRVAKEADVAILVIGLNHDYESEGFDRPDMELPGLTNRLVSEVIRANPTTVVVNQSGTPVTMPWIDETHTVVQAFYGGNELGNGLADVLFGKINPSAKLPITFPKRIEDSTSHLSFSVGQEYGKVHYNEGIFVGYRSFDRQSITPLFPFGHGLSYSTFTYSDLSVSEIEIPSLKISVAFTIKNTSDISGREIAQVYVADTESSLPRAVKELKAFIKVSLDAGESKRVTLRMDREAFGYYDDRRASWVAEKGKFGVLFGASLSDMKLVGETELAETVTWTGL